MSAIPSKLARDIITRANALSLANLDAQHAGEKRAAWTQTPYGGFVDSFQKASRNVAHGPLGVVVGTAGYIAAQLCEMPSALIGGFHGADQARDDALAQAVRVWNTAVKATGLGNQYGISEYDVEPRRQNVASVRERLSKEAPAAVTAGMQTLLEHIEEASAKSNDPTPDLTAEDRAHLALT